MYQRTKLPVVHKPVIPKGPARHEGPRSPSFQTLQNEVRLPLPTRRARSPSCRRHSAESSGEISGDHVCSHLVVAGDRARVYLVRPKLADREGLEMDAVDVGAWNANWAWSLPLIVLNVVIHVIGLGLINESVVRVLSGAIPHRRFMPTFATGMGAVVLLATALHGIEGGHLGHRLPASQRPTQRQVCDSLFAQRINKLRP